jgi:hypothetical protein
MPFSKVKHPNAIKPMGRKIPLRFFNYSFLLLLLIIFSPPPVSAENTMNLLFSGNTQGETAPCG